MPRFVPCSSTLLDSGFDDQRLVDVGAEFVAVPHLLELPSTFFGVNFNLGGDAEASTGRAFSGMVHARRDFTM